MQIRLALLLDRHPRDCRHLPRDCLRGLSLPTTSRPAPMKITIYGWSTR
jgi:hypothetical protein